MVSQDPNLECSETDPQVDRYKDITSPYEIEAWLGFDFSVRQDMYSAQKYHW